jgi:DNA polymerase theta
MLTCFPAESYLSDDLAVAFRRASGISGRLYDWQAECLTAGGVLNVGPVAGCLRFCCYCLMLLPPALLPAHLAPLTCRHLSVPLPQGKNLVYCAPTSGGKSLVAEVLMLRRIMTANRPAMLVLPFVSICSEKSEHLRWGWRVGGGWAGLGG